MKLTIVKPATSKVIGGLRVSPEIYRWLEKMAKEYGVSMQEVIRNILQINFDRDKLTNKQNDKR